MSKPMILQSCYRYVRKEQKSIANNLDISVKGLHQFKWGPCPWQSLAEAEAEQQATVALHAAEVGNWKIAQDAQGREYYWNTVTRRTTWNKPMELQKPWMREPQK